MRLPSAGCGNFSTRHPHAALRTAPALARHAAVPATRAETVRAMLVVQRRWPLACFPDLMPAPDASPGCIIGFARLILCFMFAFCLMESWNRAHRGPPLPLPPSPSRYCGSREGGARAWRPRGGGLLQARASGEVGLGGGEWRAALWCLQTGNVRQGGDVRRSPCVWGPGVQAVMPGPPPPWGLAGRGRGARARGTDCAAKHRTIVVSATGTMSGVEGRGWKGDNLGRS